MPASTPKLSPVAVEYLRNYDELEAARDLFLGERSKLLDSLGAVMIEAAGKLKQKVEPRPDDTHGLFDVYTDAAYVALRAKSGKKRRSGYSAGLGSCFGHVGAQTLIWFHLKLTPGRHTKLELAALDKALGGTGARVFGEGEWLYIRTAAQSAADLDLQALSDETRRLPELFAVADAWIVKRWRD